VIGFEHDDSSFLVELCVCVVCAASNLKAISISHKVLNYSQRSSFAEKDQMTSQRVHFHPLQSDQFALMSDIYAWNQFQAEVAHKVVTADSANLLGDYLIGGFDISGYKQDLDTVCAGLVICNTKHEVVYEDYIHGRMTVPYVAGYLGFREVPFYKELFDRIPVQWMPDVFMVDGNGMLHPRRADSASHLGVLIDCPVIGVAKTLHMVDGLDEKLVKQRFRSTCQQKGMSMSLFGNVADAAGKFPELGAALHTHSTQTPYMYRLVIK
jgi:deoxyinosine 3'endonuclease (endonuclease V)